MLIASNCFIKKDSISLIFIAAKAIITACVVDSVRFRCGINTVVSVRTYHILGLCGIQLRPRAYFTLITHGANLNSRGGNGGESHDYQKGYEQH